MTAHSDYYELPDGFVDVEKEFCFWCFWCDGTGQPVGSDGPCLSCGGLGGDIERAQ